MIHHPPTRGRSSPDVGVILKQGISTRGYKRKPAHRQKSRGWLLRAGKISRPVLSCNTAPSQTLMLTQHIIYPSYACYVPQLVYVVYTHQAGPTNDINRNPFPPTPSPPSWLRSRMHAPPHPGQGAMLLADAPRARATKGKPSLGAPQQQRKNKKLPLPYGLPAGRGSRPTVQKATPTLAQALALLSHPPPPCPICAAHY